MRIIQLVSRIEGSGVTKYTNELHHALQSIGHIVEYVLADAHLNNTNSELTGQTILPNKTFDLSTEINECTEYVNEFDLVIINSFVDKKAPLRDAWIELVTNKITTKKVIVINDHKSITFTSYYGDLLKRKDFWLSMSKICVFSYDNIVYTKIRKLIGEDEATKRYVHLQHPYQFDDAIKEKWIKPENKYRRVCYLGRHCTFKDDTRLLRGREGFIKHKYELEMRGIRPTMNTITIPNFKYVLDENGKPLEKKPYVPGDRYVLSPYTYWCEDGKHWKNIMGLPYDCGNLVDYPRELDRIYIFSAYKHDEGLEIISKYAYGCNFYNLDTPECYGDNFEYTIFEMIQYGTIPLMDYGAGEAIHILDTNTNLIDNEFGMFLKKDLSNIEDCLFIMDKVFENPGIYHVLRNHIYELCKQHTNPEKIAKQFIKDVEK